MPVDRGSGTVKGYDVGKAETKPLTKRGLPVERGGPPQAPNKGTPGWAAKAAASAARKSK